METAKIVGIHGIANTFLTAPQLRDSWYTALAGGIETPAVLRSIRSDRAVYEFVRKVGPPQ